MKLHLAIYLKILSQIAHEYNSKIQSRNNTRRRNINKKKYK